MTNEEIKKSLKICTGFPCEGCSYDDNFSKCVVRLKEDARELIIKQEEEIERLKALRLELRLLYLQARKVRINKSGSKGILWVR